MHALMYAKEGEIEILTSEQKMLFVIDDNGEDIKVKDIPKATLIARFSMTPTMGRGFLKMF
jgi:hypothetical protein